MNLKNRVQQSTSDLVRKIHENAGNGAIKSRISDCSKEILDKSMKMKKARHSGYTHQWCLFLR